MKDPKARASAKATAAGAPSQEGRTARTTAEDTAREASESTVVEETQQPHGDAAVDAAATSADAAAADSIAATPAADKETSEQAEDLPPLDEIDVLRLERDELKDKLLRLAAEYDNFRKRNAREWQDNRKRAASDVLREVLEVCDNLERALETTEDDGAGLRKGVELIHQQFQALFNRFGIESYESEGQPFDPRVHEAVQMIESDEVESQHVVNVVQRGYKLHGEVLRAARVVVSK